ncbi:GNAT family N-acetyltransferase [Rhodobaculum claviforme]|nr:GNAT family N-acetyltransferase [Rhodobaculum claviforme]
MTPTASDGRPRNGGPVPEQSAPLPRPLRPEDEAGIARLAARAFPRSQAVFVRAGSEGFVLDAEDGLAAAVLVRVIVLPGGRRIGFVAWAMTDPAHQGRGLAPALARRGIARLEALGCDAIVTEIEGHNAASEGAFRKLGFRRIGLRDQIAAFGLAGAARMRLSIGHGMDPGHFIWLRGASPTPTVEGRERALAWGLNGAFAVLALAMGGGLVAGGMPALPSAAQAGLALLAVALVLGIREGAMRTAARLRGLAVTCRAWDSGLTITAAVAVLFGNLFPLPGSVYPAAEDWRARDAGPALATAALAGSGAVAVLVGLAIWAGGAFAGTMGGAVAAAVLLVGKPLLLFDTVMAFPPFHAFNARRIYEHHRGVWAGMAALGVLLFLL